MLAFGHKATGSTREPFKSVACIFVVIEAVECSLEIISHDVATSLTPAELDDWVEERLGLVVDEPAASVVDITNRNFCAFEVTLVGLTVELFTGETEATDNPSVKHPTHRCGHGALM